MRQRCLLLTRGTGPAGLRKLRPSAEGVYGPGIYFYAGPGVANARSYASRDGGVIVAVASPAKVEYHRVERGGFLPGRDDVAVARSAEDVQVIGVIPTEQTLDRVEFEHALRQLAKRAPKWC